MPIPDPLFGVFFYKNLALVVHNRLSCPSARKRLALRTINPQGFFIPAFQIGYASDLDTPRKYGQLKSITIIFTHTCW